MEEYSKVLDRLQAQCSKREYCSSDVFKKAMKAFEGNRELSGKILQALLDDKFVDDLRYASAYAREKARLTGWGPAKITYTLVGKGIPRDVVAKALEEVTEVTEPIDMTVFIKNPNIYVTKASTNDFSDDMAPGWHIEGTDIQGNWGTSGGGGHFATNDVPADEALTISSAVVVTQEITDLPNGTYQVTAFLGERKADPDMIKIQGVEGETDEEKLASARAMTFPKEYLFINTSATAEGEFDNKTQVQSNGVSWGVKDENKIVSKKFTVTDGKITLGVRNEGSPAWFAFNEIRIDLVPNSVMGDVNNDNKITMADANLIVNYYLAPGNYPNFPVEAADLNDDHEITMADANAVVNIYLAGESE